jgi:hypothetical protein
MKSGVLIYGIIGLFVTSLYSAAWDALEDWQSTYLARLYDFSRMN